MGLKKVGYDRLLTVLGCVIYFSFFLYYYFIYILDNQVPLFLFEIIVVHSIFFITASGVVFTLYRVFKNYTPKNGEYEIQYRNPKVIISPAKDLDPCAFYLLTEKHNGVDKYYLWCETNNKEIVDTYYEVDKTEITLDYSKQEAEITEKFIRAKHSFLKLPFRKVGYKIFTPYFTIKTKKSNVL
jgi:hypothetical protein